MVKWLSSPAAGMCRGTCGAAGACEERKEGGGEGDGGGMGEAVGDLVLEGGKGGSFVAGGGLKDEGVVGEFEFAKPVVGCAGEGEGGDFAGGGAVGAEDVGAVNEPCGELDGIGGE